jgi:hypothetical protein
MTPVSVIDRLSTDGRWQTGLWSVLVLGVIAWAWLRLGSVQMEVDQAGQRHRDALRDVQRIAELRQRTVELAAGARVDVDLVTRAQRALGAVGLPSRACQGVQPRADQAGGSAGPRQQSVELLLTGLTPGEFGSWLSAWNTPDQPWRIREVVFNHQAQGLPGQESTALDSNRFQINLLLSAPSVEDAP